MQLVPLENLPNVETEPSTDWALVSHQIDESQLNYLAYAVKRDFLSTPRTYAILSLKQTQQNQVKINEFLLQEFFDQKEISQKELNSGFYCLNEQQNTLLLILNNQLLEIECSSFEHIDTLYYCLDSDSALTEYIDNL